MGVLVVVGGLAVRVVVVIRDRRLGLFSSCTAGQSVQHKEDDQNDEQDTAADADHDD